MPVATSGNTVPAKLLDVMLAIVRYRPGGAHRANHPQRESQVLYNINGTALAEFSNGYFTA